MPNQENNHRIDYMEFPATDMAAVKTFYQTVFRWEFQDWGEAYMSFNDGRLDGGFYKADKSTPNGAYVILYAMDLEATQDAVRQAGGQIKREIFSFPGGRRFHFLDPSGNELAVWSDTGVEPATPPAT